jgi:protein SCO1/2
MTMPIISGKRFLRRAIAAASYAILLLALPAARAATYAGGGIVLKVDPVHHSMVVSCRDIPGFMDAMIMPLNVRDPKQLTDLRPGAIIDFTLVVNKEDSYAENIIITSYDSAEREPAKAKRLQTFEELLASKDSPPMLSAGDAVPTFTLTDQQNRSVSLSQFAGKVIALNFIYTRCALPEYCYRMTNHFGNLQKRFKPRLGKDLVLLTVTFDPVHDRPETLAEYAKTWKADPENWRFLTGDADQVERVCTLFGVSYFPEEGLLTHSLHTAVIDRKQRLVSNLEGNQFTAQQLGDLLDSVMNSP